jgi:hypothetical protein
MSEPLRIVVPWDPMLTSDNQLRRRHAHWRARGEMNRRARETAWAAWVQAGQPTFPVPVKASVTIRRARQMDLTNAIGGLKPVIDGLFVKAIVPDDGGKWFRLGEVQLVTGKEWSGREEVEFVVTPLEEQAA